MKIISLLTFSGTSIELSQVIYDQKGILVTCPFCLARSLIHSVELKTLVHELECEKCGRCFLYSVIYS